MDKAVLDERTRMRFEHRRWRPCWSGVFERYARAETGRNLWRVRRYLNGDFEDGLQECAEVFARCIRYYENTGVDNPAWFMAIYKTALRNQWIKIANRDTAMRAAEEAALSNATIRGLCSYNDGPITVKWSEAAPEAKAAVEALVGAPAELLNWLFSPGSSMQTINRRLRRQFGLPPDLNVMGELARMIIE